MGTPLTRALLSIKNLTVNFETDCGHTRALSGFGYELAKGETLAVVGESGCGKTAHALAILGLLPCPPAKIISGEILFNGKNTLRMRGEELRMLRGGKISMIFQNPMTSLNPIMSIGGQIAETIIAHTECSRRDALKKAESLLESVGIQNPSASLKFYPHQFSGGMRQRAMIAMALSTEPEILIADEPTTALDVTIQAQILDLMREITKKNQMSLILITHNMGIVADIADKVLVIYAGRCVEKADTAGLFKAPRHPYTQGLLASMPSVSEKKEKLASIAGAPPAGGIQILGCAFAPRCSFVMEKCRQKEPPLFSIGAGHLCRCWLVENEHRRY